MKKRTDYTLLAVAIPVFIAAVTSWPGCYSDKRTEAVCTYKGAECPSAQFYLRDYQIEYFNDTCWIYDGDRLVGTHVDTASHGLWIDSTIIADNQ